MKQQVLHTYRWYTYREFIISNSRNKFLVRKQQFRRRTTTLFILLFCIIELFEVNKKGSHVYFELLSFSVLNFMLRTRTKLLESNSASLLAYNNSISYQNQSSFLSYDKLLWIPYLSQWAVRSNVWSKLYFTII